MSRIPAFTVSLQVSGSLSSPGPGLRYDRPSTDLHNVALCSLARNCMSPNQSFLRSETLVVHTGNQVNSLVASESEQVVFDLFSQAIFDRKF